MQRDERVGCQRQALGATQFRRKRIAGCSRVDKRRFDQPAQLLLAQILARGIDRREVGCGRGIAQVVGLDREAMPVRPSTEAHAGPGKQLRFEPRLVEPRRAHLACAVCYPCSEDVESPAPPAGRLADHAVQDRFVVTEELGDEPLRHRMLVATRPVRE